MTDEDDIERHLALYDAGAPTSYAHGIELLLRGMLQAPRFLYRVEIGTDEKINDRAVRLSPFEVASRLSYAIWETSPDSALQQAADEGRLSTQDESKPSSRGCSRIRAASAWCAASSRA